MLTSPAAGAMENDGVSTYLVEHKDDIGAGPGLREQEFRLTATGGTITIANFFGHDLQQLALVSAGEYEIESDCWFLCTLPARRSPGHSPVPLRRHR